MEFLCNGSSAFCLLMCATASGVGQCSSVGSSLLWVSEDWNGILCEFQSRSMDGTGILSGFKVTVKQNKDLSVNSKILPNSRPVQ